MPPKKRSKKKKVMVETNEGSEKDSGPSTSQALDDEPPGAKRRKISDGVRKAGIEKAFPQKIKSSMTAKKQLHANRRGVVSNFSENEKPSFTAEELIENRRRGISFSSIGKKLGIDNTKDEVLCVYEAMKQCDATLPDVSKEEHPMVKTYPTPLWYMFNSELDIVAKESIPDIQQVLATQVQERVSSRLGERACDMLTAYIEVAKVMKEEVIMSVVNCSSSSSLGKLNIWTNELPSKVLRSASDVFISVATSSLQHTKDLDVRNCTGRCQCGGVRVLKFVWKPGCDSMPSFFWGCVRYRANERYQHDRAISFRSATVYGVLSKAQYLSKISDTDLRVLEQLLVDQVKYYKEGEPITEDMLSRITKIYGGTPDTQTNEGVAEYINSFVLQVTTELKRRQQKASAILPDIQEDSEETLAD